MDAKRGYVPEDERNFSVEALKTMQTASRHIFYLINEGYDLKQASTFVGNHFLLSERQRLAITRSLATDIQLKERKKKHDSVLLNCMDGTIRDLAALRGTYRLIPETSQAIQLMFNVLQNAGVSRINILLDEPVSNSGRLKARIADIAEDFSFDLDIRILREVDRELYGKENVITSDSIILDHCLNWVNLSTECLAIKKMCAVKVW